MLTVFNWGSISWNDPVWSDHCSNTSLRNSKHHRFWANIQVNTKNLAECNILPQPASSCNKKTPPCKLPDAEKTCLLPRCLGSNLLAGRGTSRPGTSTSKRCHNSRSRVRRRQRTCRQGRWPRPRPQQPPPQRPRGRRWGQQHKDDVKFLVCQLQHKKKKKTLCIRIEWNFNASLSWRLNTCTALCFCTKWRFSLTRKDELYYLDSVPVLLNQQMTCTGCQKYCLALFVYARLFVDLGQNALNIAWKGLNIFSC